MRSFLLPFVLSLGLAAAAPASVSAQDASGSEQAVLVTTEAGARWLDFTGWIGGTFTRRLDSARVISPAGGGQAEERNGQIGVGLAYGRTARRTAVNTAVQGGFRADPMTEQLWTSDYRGALAVSFSLSRRTRLETRQMAKYATINPFAAIPGTDDTVASGAVPGHAGPMALRRAVTSAATTTLTHELSRRTSLVFTHGYSYAQGELDGGLHAHSAGGRLERQLNEHATARLGYRLTYATFDPANPKFLSTHDLDTGIDYRRQLPFSRRTTVTMGSGGSVIHDRERRTLRLLADVSLSHAIGRDWLARLRFGRPVQMLEGMAQPLVATSVGAVVAGELGRRSRLIASADYLNGHVSLDFSNSTRIEGYTAILGWQTTLARKVALTTEVFHGRLLFGPQVTMVSGVPSGVGHVGLRAYLSFSRPISRN